MLTKIKTILKTPKYLIIVALIIAAIILFWIKNIILPKIDPQLSSLPLIKEPEIQIEIINNYPVQNIRFIGQKPVVPQQLALYEAKEAEKLNSFCQAAAQNFGLNFNPIPEGKESPVDTWIKDSFSLSCDRVQNIAEISNPSSFTNKPDLESAKRNAGIFAKEVGINLDQFTLEKIEYYQTSNLSYFPSTPEKGNLINLKYQKIVNSRPVFQTHSNTFPLEILIGANNSIVKLKYYPTSQQTTEKNTYPLISIDQAVNQLNQGKGKLTFLEYLTEDGPSYYGEIPFSIKGISSASLDEVNLVYFYDFQKNLFIPSYVFSGTGIASDRKKVTLSLLIAALDPQYLLP